MNRAAEGTLAIGGAVKGLILTLGSFVVMGYGVYLLFTHHVGRGLLIIFIGEPAMLFVADLLTGVILAVIVAVAGVLGWSLKRHDSPEAPETSSSWDA